MSAAVSGAARSLGSRAVEAVLDEQEEQDRDHQGDREAEASGHGGHRGRLDRRLDLARDAGDDRIEGALRDGPAIAR